MTMADTARSALLHVLNAYALACVNSDLEDGGVFALRRHPLSDRLQHPEFRHQFVPPTREQVDAFLAALNLRDWLARRALISLAYVDARMRAAERAEAFGVPRYVRYVGPVTPAR